MALDYTALLRDVEQESDRLIDGLYSSSADAWETPTPAAGWAIRDQISHLAFFDDFAHLALTDADQFRLDAAQLMARGTDFPDRVAEDYRRLSPTELLNWFTESRNRLITAFATDDPRRRLPWFGPDMSVASSATARLMETWAHGQDVYDALGVGHPLSSGLRSIAHLGVSTFAFAHRLNGRQVPEEPVRVELDAPDTNEIWTWGPDDAMNRVTGPAEDFVLVVTQRRHPDDTDLTVEGDIAASWLEIAQAYAGAPGRGHARRIAAH
ncbi:TIGR03084 family metal-binding protein [Nocardia sp. NBC_00565]|uniref:TIGR03084 family metal-binding protein n=1 Tax=Nocardia sp. NBC_00565 TaxID=2975993 RepID=UPI002E80C120|nr:TIGR03084 family metal-binding protein [Nocardia sp. NBC_00565]WUC07920.1 TIGR03084 family metal-binding protein [Nocardia sp. NBC_00565]